MADPRCRHFSVKALRHNSINTFRYTNNTSTWTTTLLLPLYIGTSNSPARYALLFPFPHRIPTRSHSATSRTANHTRTSTPPPHPLNKMCQYRVTTFRCGHTRKLPIPPCHLRPAGCSAAHDLVELSNDLGQVRAAIRMTNLRQNIPGYHRLIAQIRANYGSWFGHGSANGDRVVESLRQLEHYLAREIDAVATNVTVWDWSEVYCLDSCWEAMVAMGREEQWRRGNFQGSYGG